MNQVQSKGINEIIDERVAMVKCGTCRDCQFCVPLAEEMRKEWWKRFVAVCVIQSNVNPIFFTREELDMGIRRRCDDGSWKGIDACFAYQPKICELICDSVEEGENSARHRTYLDCLDRASRLQHEIQDVQSGKAQAELRAHLDMIATGDFSYYEV